MSRPITVTPELFREVFEVDKRGAAILQYLAVRFSQNAVTDGGIDAVLKTFERMGANSVIVFIDTQIARANGVKPTEIEVQSDT